jgi:hypothetical protein
MQSHALFPTLILQDRNLHKHEIKNTVIKTMQKYINDDGFSNVTTGHVLLHHDDMYKPIYVMATRMAREYCKVMEIDPNQFDFNVVKSWFNILKDQPTPTHNHSDVHLCFSYYVNMPKEYAQPIQFYAPKNKPEPYERFVINGNPSSWNVFNSSGWTFPCEEGDMFMWPGCLMHDTIGKGGTDLGVKTIDDIMQSRVSIAGDILITYKDKTNTDLGLQPVKYWRTFG